MPFYRLGNVLREIATGADSQSVALNTITNEAEANSAAEAVFIREAQVIEVFGSGCQVMLEGGTFYADGATDEPFQAGQMVYVSQTQDGGFIIHGSVKT